MKVLLATVALATTLALVGAPAGADDGGPDTSPSRHISFSIVCDSVLGGEVHVDTDGNGVYDTHWNVPCYGQTFTHHFTMRVGSDVSLTEDELRDLASAWR